MTATDKTWTVVHAFGPGWLDFIDWIFFHLPFSGPVQVIQVRDRELVKKEDWDRLHAKMAADHRADGAREELRLSWKAYVTEHVRGNGAESGSTADFVCGVELGADD